jgi:phosphoadenosine phosphosulfate reductase
MGAALRREDALHARTRPFRQRVDRAIGEIETALELGRRWYVAFSGGKDSLVVLDLARLVRPGITAIWADDELIHPGEEEFVLSFPELQVVQGWARHAGWFDPWREEPFWREPLPQMRWIGQEMEPWSLTAGYDGCLVGIRAAEARHRRIATRRFGGLFQAVDGQWRAWPLRRWSDADIWAYIGDRGLHYHPAYDVYARLGMPRETWRVGPLPLSDAWVLRQGWPGLMERLEARYGRQWGFS